MRRTGAFNAGDKRLDGEEAQETGNVGGEHVLRKVLQGLGSAI